MKNLLVFFAFAPYLSFSLLDIDTQPYFLIFCICYLVSIKGRLLVPRSLKVSYLLLAISLCWSVVLAVASNKIDFMLIRGILSYLTFSLGILVLYAMFCKGSLPNTHVFISINVLYLAIALMQKMGISSFEFLSPNRGALSSGRGVTSMAAEPTFYGMVIYFLSLAYYLESKFNNVRNRYSHFIFYSVSLVNIFLSASSMVLVWCLLTLVSQIKNKYLIISIPIVILLTYAALIWFPDFRFSRLVYILINSGLYDLLTDGSVNERVSAVIFPYIGNFNNIILPSGFHAYEVLSSSLRNSIELFDWGSGGKIMNFIGAFIFELGIFAAFIHVIFITSLHKLQIFNVKYILLLFFILNTSIPVASGYIAFFYALVFYRCFNRHEKLDRNYANI
jgi:hypothetical protein